MLTKTYLHKLRFLFFISLLLTLAGCASEQKINMGNVGSLSGLKQMSAPRLTPRERYQEQKEGLVLSNVRYTALEQSALSIGARAALAWRSKQINVILQQDAPILNQAYNFYGLMLPNNVLPPVLLTAQNTLNLASPNVLRLASQVYKIKSQARFVTAPPTWRDYIWMDYSKPARPDNSLLPQNNVEQEVWNHYVTQGWHNGIIQANNIFAANLARLNQDYTGMVLYLKLLQENMVSAPFVAKTNLGITGDASHMSINDQVLRITALPSLNLNGNTWKPIIVPDPLSKYKLNLLKQIYPKQIPKRISKKIKRELYIK